MKYTLVLLLLLSSCSTSTSYETHGPVIISFCPYENCGAELLKYIQNAHEVDCAFYDIDQEELIKAIKERGRLIVDEHVEGEFTKRVGPGLMHNKFCILDNKQIVTGSYNPTRAGQADYNNLLFIESTALAHHYQEQFDQLIRKNKKPSTQTIFLHNGFVIESYACPQDNCQKHLLETLQEAQSSIQLALFTFTDTDLSLLLREKIRQGVQVSGIVESWQSQEYEQYSILQEHGAQVILEQSKLLQHNKVFIIDNATVITGSYNPTKAATTINDENILIIRDKNMSKVYSQLINYVQKYPNV